MTYQATWSWTQELWLHPTFLANSDQVFPPKFQWQEWNLIYHVDHNPPCSQHHILHASSLLPYHLTPKFSRERKPMVWNSSSNKKGGTDLCISVRPWCGQSSGRCWCHHMSAECHCRLLCLSVLPCTPWTASLLMSTNHQNKSKPF